MRIHGKGPIQTPGTADPFAVQDDQSFEFQELDGIAQVGAKYQRFDGKWVRRVLVPCPVCHVPGCMYEKEELVTE